jgi:hypothetical protein
MHSRAFFLPVCCVLIAALTVTPLMAQNASTAKVKVVFDRDEALHIARQRLMRDPGVTVADGTTVLLALPSAVPSAAFPSPQATAPGKNKTMIVVATGGALLGALIYMLFRGGDDKPTPTPTPTTPATILAAGTPKVSNQ